MFELVDQLLYDLKLSVCESIDVPSRPESHTEVPEAIAHGPAANVLNARIPGSQVWTHQAIALEHLCADRKCRHFNRHCLR